MAYGKWSASKSAKRDFAKKMQEIETFCAENGIERSRTFDSFIKDPKKPHKRKGR